jgi:hypothetical protein
LEFDCSKKKTRFLSVTVYNKDGAVIGTFPYDPRSWMLITPDFVGEKLFNIACGSMFHSSLGDGADWKYLAKDPEGSSWFYDTKSVSREQSIVKVFVRSALSEEGKKFFIKRYPKKSGIEKISDTVDRFEINCSNNMGRTLSSVWYDTEGKVIYSGDYPDNQFQKVTPDSIMDMLVKIICKKGENLTSKDKNHKMDQLKPAPVKEGKEMDFLKKIKWGIGKEETQAIFRDKKPMPPHPTQNAIGFFGSIYGVPGAVVCYFRKGLLGREKLARVNVALLFETPEDDIIEKKYIQVKTDLLTQYGSPAHQGSMKDAPPEFRQSELLVWVVGDSILILDLRLNRDGVSQDKCGISVIYGDAKNDPISRQWNWLRAK